MTSHDEVLREFKGPWITDKGIDRTIDAMADEIVQLREQLAAMTQERDEDQGVIAVWRGRTHRAEERAERMERVVEAVKDYLDNQPLGALWRLTEAVRALDATTTLK